MEFENKVRNGGFEGIEGTRRRTRVRFSDIILRFLAMTLTLLAVIMYGVDKQTKFVPVTINSSLPPLRIAMTAQWRHMSALVYFLVVNSVACAHASISLLIKILGNNKGGKKGLIVVAIDLLMVALLFSGGGAAAAIGVVGYRGNSHARWKKVCNVFDRFCKEGAIAIVLSFLGSLAFLLLVLLVLLCALNFYMRF